MKINICFLLLVVLLTFVLSCQENSVEKNNNIGTTADLTDDQDATTDVSNDVQNVTIKVDFKYGSDTSDGAWKNIYAVWIENEDASFLQNIFICKKLIDGGLTGIALPFWKINKYPSSDTVEIDAVTSATTANADFTVSALIKDKTVRTFTLYFEIDRSFEANDWFEDQPALLYSAEIDLDNLQSGYTLSLVGWTPNDNTENKIENTPKGMLQKETRYITHAKKSDGSFGELNLGESSTKMVKEITAAISVQ